MSRQSVGDGSCAWSRRRVRSRQRITTSIGALPSRTFEIRLRLTNAARIRSLTLAFIASDGWRSGCSDRASRRLPGQVRGRLDDDFARPAGGGDSRPRDALGGVRPPLQLADDSLTVRLTMTARSGAGATPPSAELESIGATPRRHGCRRVCCLRRRLRVHFTCSARAHFAGRHMPANVAVIGKYTELPTYGHLNVFELRQLQDQWGAGTWSTIRSATQTR